MEEIINKIYKKLKSFFLKVEKVKLYITIGKLISEYL